MVFESQHQEVDIYRFVIQPTRGIDPRSAGYLADAHALDLTRIEQIICHDLYFIEGCLQTPEIGRLSNHLLSDPITQSVEWTCQRERNLAGPALLPGYHLVEVALRPGVTDPVAEQIVRAAHQLGIEGVLRASTGLQFLVAGQDIDEGVLVELAKRLLANPIIQRYTIGIINPVFPQAVEASGQVERIAIRELNEGGLMALSANRRAALDLEEMRAIQRMYQEEQRDMTDVEFETIAQTWSEHCVHKTFKALVTLQNPGDSASSAWLQESQVDNLFRTYIKGSADRIQAPWVRSAFVDNAGIIDFDARNEISFKVETHNHPSAIEPFGGANTGVGGVIRDVIGVSAKPIAATDVLCFGPASASFSDLPAGVLHPRRIRSGVVAGVQDYGNKIGIPTVSGAVIYDPGFTANPLVFCGCVGIAPKDSHPRSPEHGDRVIILGGRTGRDGLRGATFSSMTMDAQTGEVAGASVQIGEPIVEKGLIDVIMQARDQRLYHAITDCGAGGLSSAIGEMASEIGADIELEQVRLKYPGLAPWEIWLSEAQERMVLAIPEEALPELLALCRTYDVELTDAGAFTGSGRLVVRYQSTVVLDLPNAFLHHGIPQRKLQAVLPRLQTAPPQSDALLEAQLAEILLDLLAHPNIASKESIIRIYDHEVQGATAIKPLVGVQNDGPSDAVVLKPAAGEGQQALVLAAGINPQYGKQNAYRMAWSVVDEAVRNAVAVGADPDRIALLDNFCWGDPRNPETLGSLIEACRGCYDASLYYQAPFISGKDSLNNEYMGKDGKRHAIPPTLLISSIGVIDDYRKTTTMDLKNHGSRLYQVGDFQPSLGGSHVNLAYGIESDESPPEQPSNAIAVYKAVFQATAAGLVDACHDLSEGGMAVAAAEMCIASRLGLKLNLGGFTGNPVRTLFGETNGCLLMEVSDTNAKAFEAIFEGLPCLLLGTVTEYPVLRITSDASELITLPVEQLAAAWKSVDGRKP